MEGKETPIEPGFFERLKAGAQLAFTGSRPAWFGPLDPQTPKAQDAEGRRFDYRSGYNLTATPRNEEAVGFKEMRQLADGYDLMRLVIETRKDQIAKCEWTIKPRDKKIKTDPRTEKLIEFFRFPDAEHCWDDWLRALLEDLLVLDAPTIYRRKTKGGDLYALELIDGATIKRVLDGTGRTPKDGPAYQQQLKGVAAVDYTIEELLYRPRNLRTHKVYGYSPVEQVIMTVNIALRRQLHQLQFYTEGNVPEALIGVPENWTTDQIKRFQLYWDELLEGNTAQKRHAKFVPGDMKYQATKDAALKDEYDDWLARVVCYAFSVSAQPFIKEMNRATAQTSQQAALSEGLAPIQNWVKQTIDMILARWMDAPDLEFSWEFEEEQKALDKANTDAIYLDRKVITPDEVRATLNLDPLTPEQREEAWPTPVLPPMIEGDSEGEETTGEEGPPPNPPPQKNKAQGSQLKKAMRPIDRNRAVIVAGQRALNSVISQHLEAMKAKAIKHATGINKRDESGDIDLGGDMERMGKGIAKHMIVVSRDGVKVAAEQVSHDISAQWLKQANDKAVKWANTRAAELVGMKIVDGEWVVNPRSEYAISDMVRDNIRATVEQAEAEGWSNDRLAESLSDDYAFSAGRAETIARTETAFADVQGNLIAYKESGVVAGKEWVAEPDCCDICAGNERQGVIGLNDSFQDGTDAPPAHPNCLCDVYPVLGDE